MLMKLPRNYLQCIMKDSITSEMDSDCVGLKNNNKYKGYTLKVLNTMDFL